MGDTASEYIYYIVSIIVFVSAVSIFLLFLGTIKTSNANEIEVNNVKTAVNYEQKYGQTQEILPNGSSVMIDIMRMDSQLPVYLNGVQLTAEYLMKLREENKDYINDLRSRIDLDGTYRIRYEYYDNNEIKTVFYEKV